MTPTRCVACAILFLLIGHAPPAVGHGAWYPPPDERAPAEDATGGGAGGDDGPTTSGPGTGGPDSGPPMRHPPMTGLGPVPPPPGKGGPPPGGPKTSGGGGRKRRPATSSEGWEVWWEYNKDPFLRGMARGVVQSGGAVFLTGRGVRAVCPTFDAPSRDDVRSHVVPALVRALGARDAEILDSATIALGRVAEPDVAGVAQTLEEQLSSPFSTVRQSGLLALGVHGDRGSAPLLWQVMSDTSDGRAALGGGATDVERAFAALALGFACGPEMVPQIVRLIERSRGDDVEVVAGAVLTLGLVPEAAHVSAPFLAGLLEDRRLDRRVRAQVPIALARLGDAAAALVPRLLEHVSDRRADQDLRRSCAIALGRLAAPEDEEVVDVLRRVVRRENDAPLRRFSLVALGRVLARSPDEASAKPIHDLLTLELADPSSATDVPWTALALGVGAHGLAPDSAVGRSAASVLASVFKSTRNPSEVGAVAIAVGLAGDVTEGPALLDRFEETSDPALRARLAIGLGLLDHRAAIAPLSAALIEERAPTLQVDLATALRLLGDDTAGDRLVEVMRDAATFAAAAAAGRALGQVGDREEIAPLVALLEDADRSEPVRAFAAVALGLIAEKTAEPWNTPLSVDSNYLVGLGVQRAVLDIY